MKTNTQKHTSIRKPLKFLISIIYVAGALIVTSCEDFLNTKAPSKQLPSVEIFNNDATASAAMGGLYVKIMENFNSAFNSQITLWAGLSADELLNTTGSPQLEEFFSNSINSSNDQLKQYLWSPIYNYIYQANAILEGVSGSTGLTNSRAIQLEGEARVIRAFSHYYLVSIFGDVPYSTTTDYRENSTTNRKAASEVYTGIISDLAKAQSLLDDNYVSAGHIRPNKAVATALLARVYLQVQDWAHAEIEATKIIGNPAFVLQTDLNKVFLANSPEAIWQMIPVSAGLNTAEGNRFAFTSGVPLYADLSVDLLATFESGDKRRTNWVNQYTASGKVYSAPFKYKIRNATAITEYYSVLRLAEQYLIRAEARSKQGKLPEAIADLDVIRNRAGLPLIQATNPSISQGNLLLAIEHERRVELFCEWGHRWLDLKRTGRVDAVMLAYKPTKWKPTSALYPVPLTEILTNSNLSQNPGY